MKYFSLTDIGNKREKNEDSYYSQIKDYSGTEVGIFAIADGMGGYENGEYASKKAIEEFIKYVDEEFQKLNFSDIFDDDIRKSLENALDIANKSYRVFRERRSGFLCKRVTTVRQDTNLF